MAVSRGSKIFIVVLVLIVGLVGGGLAYVDQQLAADPNGGDPVTFEVERGATASTIGQRLEELGIVRSALAFRLVARSRSLDANLQAGSYELATGMSVDQAIDGLLEGPAARGVYSFRVEEGLTVEQTLSRIEAQSPYSVDELRAVLDSGDLRIPDWIPELASFGPEVRERYEGLLFPQTYEMFEDATALQVLQRMVDELDRVAAPLVTNIPERAESLGLGTYELLVLASLVERETQVDDERPTVAGVMYNRLEDGMLLQIDATVLYALGTHKDRVLNADLEVQSPYNTYRNTGLPPTPISGLGAKSLQAAYGPQSHTFVYYVVADDCTSGRHVFATTLSEHNANAQRYRAACL